jgi:hypothetical protein
MDDTSLNQPALDMDISSHPSTVALAACAAAGTGYDPCVGEIPRLRGVDLLDCCLYPPTRNAGFV